MQYTIKEMSAGEILDQAVALLRDHFGKLMKIAAIFYLPSLALVQLSSVALAQSAQTQPVRPEDISVGAFIVYIFSAFVYFLFAWPITHAATLHAAASEYLQRSVSVRTAMARAFHVYLPLIVTILMLIAILIALNLLLLVPGAMMSAALGTPLVIISLVFAILALDLIIFLPCALLAQVVIIEGVAYVDAFKRSGRLMKGNWLKAFVLLLLVSIVQAGIGAQAALIPHAYLSGVFAALLATVTFVFSAATFAVFYFSCRCRLEHFDLELLVQAVEAPDAPEPIEPELEAP